jgi:hypothetical protein
VLEMVSPLFDGSMDSIAPSIRAAQALGFIRITQYGVASNAEFRIPTLFALTHLPTNDGKDAATNDWDAIETDEEATALAKAARNAPARYGRFPKKVRRPKPDLRSRNGSEVTPDTGVQTSISELPKRDYSVTPETGLLSIPWGGGGGSDGGQSDAVPNAFSPDGLYFRSLRRRLLSTTSLPRLWLNDLHGTEVTAATDDVLMEAA